MLRENNRDNKTDINFFNEFIKKIDENKEKLSKAYNKNKIFTKYITQIICDIMNDFGLENETEYYKIDVIGYKNSEEYNTKDEKVKLMNYLWDLSFAIEHENDSTDWTYEVIKLMHIMCKNRIVISYRDKEEVETGMIWKKLEFVANMIKKLNCYSENKFANLGMMIILGNTARNDDEKFNYDCYKYNYQNEAFEKIR